MTSNRWAPNANRNQKSKIADNFRYLINSDVHHPADTFAPVHRLTLSDVHIYEWFTVMAFQTIVRRVCSLLVTAGELMPPNVS